MYIKEKIIKKKKYYYLAESFRLPDGRVKSIEKIIEKRAPLKELKGKYSDFFVNRKKEIFSEFALGKYKTASIFNKLEFKKIEDIKIDYQRTIKSFSKSQLKDVLDRFIANFTYESNAIEGNSLTLKDVAIVMFEKRAIEGKDLREIYETRNSRPLMDLLVKKKFDVSEKDIIKMHKMLMNDMDERTGYKQIPNYITGSSVKLTPPEKVKEEMGALIDWYEKAIERMHPIQASALFHGKFIKIHPFEDGNGRVGRFVSNAILINNDYPPFIIRKSQRDAYIKCMQDFFNGYTENLERLFLRKYKDTYRKFFEEYLKYIK